MRKETAGLLRLTDVVQARRAAGLKGRETFIVRAHIRAVVAQNRAEAARRAQVARYIVRDDYEDRPIGS